ncbi:iron-containing redox enzyme family protein [Actinomadura flavalba]|uniref:iron-containing redox enzyme family protein n=1 Tax=Actinomadura flavalba TaxID=1120938 RepID=UPI00036453A2|nr:iron-containing redox enzyme family protein [Actinomadura flavalba]
MTTPTLPVTGDGLAPLPSARGPLSEAVLALLTGGAPALLPAEGAEPFGDDLQLALYLCYELHYHGLRGVSADWEWNPELLAFRARLERVFLDGLRAAVPGGDDVDEAVGALLVEHLDARGASHFLRDHGTLGQLREYLAHRSVYHLKEADPHALLIPRLRGRAKAALVGVEFDEYGGGHADRMHSRLFADLMEEAGLDCSYGAYVDVVPAPMLAITGMMSLFGLHRARRAMMAGHFTAAEITTPPSAQRMTRALTRLGLGDRATLFYTEHIAADAVHEQVMRRDVLGGLLEDAPHLAADVVLGVQSTVLLEQRLEDHLLARWTADEPRTSLRAPL